MDRFCDAESKSENRFSHSTSNAGGQFAVAVLDKCAPAFQLPLFPAVRSRAFYSTVEKQNVASQGTCVPARDVMMVHEVVQNKCSREDADANLNGVVPLGRRQVVYRTGAALAALLIPAQEVKGGQRLSHFDGFEEIIILIKDEGAGWSRCC